MAPRLREFPRAIAWLIFLLSLHNQAFGQDNKRVVMQGFWWNFSNKNYPMGWANYLADMAPRLRATGVQAVWVPPHVKNANPGSVGYVPFDHYDLGDKYQKGNLKTPLGDKDEYLRMVAVLHANGIEVMEDMVFNHMNDAGSATGAGGVDSGGVKFYKSVGSSLFQPDPTGGAKTFRYTSYAIPAKDESAADYLARNGRFSKNWQNFYPNPSDNRQTGDDISKTTFGPDIGYNDGSFGKATSATWNPTQASRYMRDNMRAWTIWDKKQTGADGWRLDAVKHYPTYAAEDFLYNVQYNAGFASATAEMLAVGEWVGGDGELTAWTDAVQGRAGAFDFALRGFAGGSGCYSMVYGLGNYDIGSLPSAQQSRRYRSFSFVNSHDTFRPTLLANGDYPTSANWNAQGELAPHIDPREPRLAAAYAVTMAMDGNPVVFIEDLFDIGTTGKRYTHLPNSTIDLPLRADIGNLIACHNALGFKKGTYLVPYQASDYLIIERKGQAIIGITDNFTTWQAQWITTQFAAGTQLIDYGGSSPVTDVRTVAADGRVQISTPPCNGTALRRGYSVWAPKGQTITNLNPTALPTVQEWEMADDLGDSHPNSLGQGGALPDSSFGIRYAGKIYPEAGKAISVKLFVSDTTKRVTLLWVDNCRNIIDSVTGKGNLSKTITPAATGWLQFAIRQGAGNQTGQRCWVNVTYTAPKTIDAKGSPSFIPTSVDLGLDRDLCRFTGRLSAFTSNGFTYQWKDSAGTVVGTNQALVPPYPGPFSVLKTSSASGCTATDTVRVLRIVDLPNQPQIRVSGDTLLFDGQPGVTYQWYLNSALIPGATDTFYKAGTQKGTYGVKATNSTNCSINSPTFNYVVSIRAQIEAGMELLPNPTQGVSNLRLSGLAAGAIRLALVLPDGRRQYLGTHQTAVDFSSYPAGIYVVEVTTPEGVGHKRVVRQ